MLSDINLGIDINFLNIKILISICFHQKPLGVSILNIKAKNDYKYASV